MQKKTIGTLIGAAALILWYFPLVTLGGGGFQAGHHIGGIAYLLFPASLGYAMLSWMEQHVPRIITGSVALGISCMFLLQAGVNAGWALYLLIAVNAAAVLAARRDYKGHAHASGTTEGVRA